MIWSYRKKKIFCISREALKLLVNKKKMDIIFGLQSAMGKLQFTNMTEQPHIIMVYGPVYYFFPNSHILTGSVVAITV